MTVSTKHYTLGQLFLGSFPRPSHDDIGRRLLLVSDMMELKGIDALIVSAFLTLATESLDYIELLTALTLHDLLG